MAIKLDINKTYDKEVISAPWKVDKKNVFS